MRIIFFSTHQLNELVSFIRQWSSLLQDFRTRRPYTESLSYTESICQETNATCSVSTSESILTTCQYKWSKANTPLVRESHVLVMTDFSSSHGVFVCHVTYQVRGGACQAKPITINSTSCSGRTLMMWLYSTNSFSGN